MDQPRSNDLRGLKALVGILGVLIVLGTALVIGVVIQRIYAKPAAASMSVPLPGSPVSAPFVLPVGSRVAGIAAAGAELAVWVTGPAGDQIWLLDPRSGAHFVTMTAPK
jgi:streptogramin lyase